jgi:flagellar basal body-associated protein FliL
MMAEETDPAQESEESPLEGQSTDSAQKSGFLACVLSVKGLAILLGVSIVGHGVAFTCFRWRGTGSEVVPSAELSLGDFRFVADPFEGARAEESRVSSAEFSLHIELVRQFDSSARQQLTARKFRVRQDIEELLRRAHSGDFDNPLLGELKRQLQEQINTTLGMGAVAEVIITDLKLQRETPPAGPLTETVESVPWVEKPST